METYGTTAAASGRATMATLAGVVLALAMGTRLCAQFSWQLAATNGPTGREATAMAFDPIRNRTLLYGGGSGFGAFLADTWTWDGATWIPQFLATGPGPRVGHAMVFHEQRGTVLLFGGTDGFNFVPGLWEWNGVNWSQVSTGGPVRGGHAMSYDPTRNKVVMFGGSPGVLAGDTWEWDASGWSLVATSGPAARNQAGLAFDRIAGRMLLFGGSGNLSVLGDTWSWNGVSWSQLNVNGPSPRHSATMASYDARGSIVLFGGYGVSGCLADCWEWDGTAWHELGISGPGGRVFHSLAYDSTRRRAVTWGGSNCSAYVTPTWELSFQTTSTFGSGCGAPPLTLTPEPAAPPVLGGTARAAVANTPTPLCFVALGWSNQMFGPFPLPVTLAGIGAPGCDLLTSSEVFDIPTAAGAGGTADFALPLPGVGSLLGVQLFLQAWCLAPGTNPGGIVVSNGLRWQLGY